MVIEKWMETALIMTNLATVALFFCGTAPSVCRWVAESAETPYHLKIHKKTILKGLQFE